jgi:cation diffusion facilitator family transporter
MATSPAEVTGQGVRRVLWITLGLNVVVSLAKILVGKLTLSLSMVADGYHSLVDGSNNIVGLMVAAFAYAPPDRGHPYGHRKFESAATTLIAAALMALSYNVLEGALTKGVRVPQIGALNWVVMLGTLAMNLFVSWYEAREGHRLGSSYLIADAAHTRSDIYVSLGVIASFAGARAGLPWTDAVVAAGIAIVIAVQAVRILVGSFHVLTDRAMLAAEEVERVVRSVPGVAACREVRTRGGPGAIYVDLVADVDGGVTLREAHEVADRIEAAVKANHRAVIDVVVHLEPTPRP